MAGNNPQGAAGTAQQQGGGEQAKTQMRGRRIAIVGDPIQVVVSDEPVKVRPGIITNVIQDQPELCDATVFMVPDIDRADLQFARNLKFEESQTTVNTWKFQPK
jgi:hypothetical protein